MSFELDKELFVSKAGSSKAHQGLALQSQALFQVLQRLTWKTTHPQEFWSYTDWDGFLTSISTKYRRNLSSPQLPNFLCCKFHQDKFHISPYFRKNQFCSCLTSEGPNKAKPLKALWVSVNPYEDRFHSLLKDCRGISTLKCTVQVKSRSVTRLRWDSKTLNTFTVCNRIWVKLSMKLLGNFLLKMTHSYPQE